MTQNSMPDFDSFKTLITLFPDLMRSQYRVVYEMLNVQWLDRSDITSRDAIQGIEKIYAYGLPVFANNPSLQRAIDTIASNASKYPNFFTDSSSPFLGLIQTLQTSFETLSQIDGATIKTMMEQDDQYEKMAAFQNYFNDFNESLFLITRMYYVYMGSVFAGDNAKPCPDFSNMLTTMLTYPRYAFLRWSNFFFLSIAQYTCMTRTYGPTYYYDYMKSYIAKLNTKSSDITNALAQIEPSDFSECFINTQLGLGALYDSLPAFLKARPADYYYVVCTGNDTPGWANESYWEPYESLMSAAMQAEKDYMTSCQTFSTTCSDPDSNYDDMMTIFSIESSVIEAGANFEALSSITYWIGGTFYQPELTAAAAIGTELINKMFSDDYQKSLTTLTNNVDKLPASVQSDFKALTSQIQTLQQTAKKTGSDFYSASNTLGQSLIKISQLLTNIRFNYLSSVFKVSPSQQINGSDENVVQSSCDHCDKINELLIFIKELSWLDKLKLVFLFFGCGDSHQKLKKLLRRKCKNSGERNDK